MRVGYHTTKLVDVEWPSTLTVTSACRDPVSSWSVRTTSAQLLVKVRADEEEEQVKLLARGRSSPEEYTAETDRGRETFWPVKLAVFTTWD